MFVEWVVCHSTMLISTQVAPGKDVGSTQAFVLKSLSVPALIDTSGKNARNFVDVRDVAEQHVLAVSTPAAGGARISSSAGEYWGFIPRPISGHSN